MKLSNVHIRRLRVADAGDFRSLRLRGLREHPEAFTSSYEEEVGKPVARTEQRLADDSSVTFWGVFVPQADRPTQSLAGVVGLDREQRAKGRHRATVVGMYVAPEYTRQGLARALLQRLLQEARASHLELLILTVTVGNAAAERLYLDAGFVSFGIEPGAIKVHNRFFDKNHMFLQLATS